eukprot:5735540-Heterocapsa_arctica.AAC.1
MAPAGSVRQRWRRRTTACGNEKDRKSESRPSWGLALRSPSFATTSRSPRSQASSPRTRSWLKPGAVQNTPRSGRARKTSSMGRSSLMAQPSTPKARGCAGPLGP